MPLRTSAGTTRSSPPFICDAWRPTMHAAMNVTVKISSGVSGTSLDTYEVQNPRDSSCLSAAAPSCAALSVFADVLPGSMA